MPPKRSSTAGQPPPPGEPGQPGQPGQTRPRGKPRGIRRDRDCITCKNRGLKCDLNRPQCLPCVQAGILCGGYPLRVVWLDERRRGPGKAAPAPAPAGPPAPTQSQSHSSHSSHSSQSQPSLPMSSLPQSSLPQPLPLPQPQSLPTISSITNPPSYAPTSAPYSTSPTITFRQAAPISSICSSPDDVPVASPPGPSSLGSSRTPPSVTSPSITGSITSTVGDEAWCETDQNSLIKRLAALCSHILTTEDINPTPQNHYLSQPETTSLLSDLCIFIQARLEGRNPPAIDHDDRAGSISKPPESLDMVRSRLTALAQVNRAIEAANPFAFLGIATFAVFEVCDDTFGEWQCHLHGARHLLEYHRCRTLADLQRMATLVPGLMDILARLVWFDLSGSVVRGSVVDGSFTTPLIFEDWHRQVLLDNNIYESVGIAEDTCALYVDVAKARLLRRPVQACLRAAEQILKVDELRPGSSKHRLSDWALATNVHRCAAALAILGQLQEAQDQAVADSGGMQDPDTLEDRAAWEATTHAAVDKLCDALAATPASSRFYIHLAVGAYMAGMRARTPEHCAVVRQYWLNCNISGISRYPGGLSRCSEHWQRVGLLDKKMSL
ncbi:putative argr fungal zinc cluster transcription factor [Ophiostoma piceae UAMH 11346]|uniref:Putative argr fungal zinc cluster transcription factor n=1 Tax=Ophiostoma piceae (strain UAMH 11346) TaxID=1262450 RepID=S3BSK7_OPHP1|nr:putative argr fungal zinc cluster transcription factor [Ophiostoma piceae UAMH 11346]